MDGVGIREQRVSTQHTRLSTIPRRSEAVAMTRNGGPNWTAVSVFSGL
jgi:hypothetical protein